jgi:large subunit ribosomal protein L30
MVVSKLENKLLAVVRVRGKCNVRQNIKETMKRLNLDSVNNLSLVFGTKSNIGMLQKCKDYVTFGEIDDKTLASLFEKKSIKVDKEAIESLAKGEKNPKELQIKLPIRMKPPKRGYKAIKIDFNSSGDLGYRGAEINALIARML